MKLEVHHRTSAKTGTAAASLVQEPAVFLPLTHTCTLFFNVDMENPFLGKPIEERQRRYFWTRLVVDVRGWMFSLAHCAQHSSASLKNKDGSNARRSERRESGIRRAERERRRKQQ